MRNNAAFNASHEMSQVVRLVRWSSTPVAFNHVCLRHQNRHHGISRSSHSGKQFIAREPAGVGVAVQCDAGISALEICHVEIDNEQCLIIVSWDWKLRLEA